MGGAVCNRQATAQSYYITYDYNAYGSPYGSIYDSTSNHIGTINPIRYRGYYYDTETGFYYLQARYYDPTTCRFINADGQLNDDKSILGANLFAYCDNNPVNSCDPDGTDCYYFYVKQFKNEAVKDQKVLMKFYHLAKRQVHLIQVNSAANITNGWNAMGSDGESIDAVVFNTHASPTELGDQKGTFKFGVMDILDLDYKSVGCLILYGCNAGLLDDEGYNVASWFAEIVNGGKVLASDGTVVGRFPFGYYWSRSDKVFNHLIKSRRKNSGWLIYQEDDAGVLTVSKSQGRFLSLKQMLEILN